MRASRSPFLALFLLTFALRAGAAPRPRAAPARPFLPYPAQVTRLPSGLTVVRIPFPSKGLVAFDTVVRVGSRNETEAGHTGFAHFFEHMMFRGTAAHPGTARGDQLALLGFQDNAFTTDDLTLFTTFGPSSALPDLVSLEADRFQHLSYSEEAFKLESRAVLGEYHKGAASPDLKLAEALLAAAFTRHPYRHTTLGFLEDIQKMPEQYAFSQAFFSRWYTPQRVTLVIAGDFDDAQLMTLVQKEYGDWKRPQGSPMGSDDVPQEPPQTKGQAVTVDWKSPTLPRLVNAWHVPAARPGSSDGALAQLLGSYLAGATSPLYKKAILDAQWAEGLSGDGEIHRDPSLFTVEAVLKEESYRPLLQAQLDAEVKQLRAGKVDASRLRDIQSALRYGAVMQADTASALAERVGYYAGVYGTPDALEQHLVALSRVTPAQLVTFARQHLTDPNRTVAAVKRSEAR